MVNAIIRRSNHYNTTNEGIKMLIDGLSEHHFKTACLVQFESAINHYSENFNIYIKSRVDYPNCYDRPRTEEDGTEYGVRWNSAPQVHVLGQRG